MEDVVPFVVKQQVDAESEEVLELGRVRLEDRKATVNECAKEVGDLKSESAKFGGDYTRGRLERELL